MAGMNLPGTGNQPDTKGEGNHGAMKVRHCSPEALARMLKGRPAKDPAIRILADRCKVSYGHAFRVAQGARKSRELERELAKIRIELAATTSSWSCPSPSSP